MKIITITILILATLFIPWHSYCQGIDAPLEAEPSDTDSIAIKTPKVPMFFENNKSKIDGDIISSKENIQALAKEDAEDEGNDNLYVIAGFLSVLPAILVTLIGKSSEIDERALAFGLPMIPVQFVAMLGLGNIISIMTDTPDRNLTGLSEKTEKEHLRSYRKNIAIKRSLSLMQGYGVAVGGVSVMLLLAAILFIIFFIVVLIYFFINPPTW